MKFRISFICLLSLTLLHSAFAVFPAKLPLPKMYETSATILVAKISKINPSNRLIDADVIETLKGEKTEKLRIQLVSPEALFSHIREGDPIVVCTARGRGAGDATIHLADTFLLGRLKPETMPALWQIIQEQSNDFKKTFPGTTNLLIEALREFKDQKPTFLNSADDRLFSEGAQALAQLKITPTSLFSADLNSDQSPQLLISTPHGPRIFSKSGESYEDTSANWSLPPTGDLLAVGDLNGDSKPDLLIDNIPYLNQGTSFKPAPPLDLPHKNQLAALTIADGKLLTLSKSGQLSIGAETKQLWKESQPPLAALIGPFDENNKLAVIVAFENSLTRYSLDGRPSDFTRLTGEPLSSYLKDSAGQFKPGLKLIPLDANGDGRRDLLVLSEGSNFLLINRGFGAFFISPAAAQNALGQPGKPFPYASSATSSHWTAIDTRSDHHEDLLILTPDGALYRLGNPPPK
jgi:hypothetical protein